jgi:DNA-binding NarL/FixJ family response regulator
VAHRGTDALALLRRAEFDLTIIDMDLDPADMGYRDLPLMVRELAPTMRLILIPLMGESLPAEALQLDIQGVLSKPFFADDLLRRIKETLARQVYPHPLPPAAPPPAAHQASQTDFDVQAALRELASETSAEAVLLVTVSKGEEKIIASVGILDKARLRKLAQLSLDAIQAAQATASLLDQPNKPFEHNIFESDSVRLYVLALPDTNVLILAGPSSTPLGTIRHNLRRTARNLIGSTGG